MEANRLDWDSDFFGIDVFNIIADKEEEVEKFILDNQNQKYLIYAFMGINSLSDKFLKKENGLLVDTKVILEKSLKKTLLNTSNSIVEYKNNQPTKELYALALESGKYSRFKQDNRLQKDKFEELYSLWIEKSCLDNETKIFVSKSDCTINGFITVSIKNKIGKIGLIAVDSSMQGKGIGNKLLAISEDYLALNSVDTIIVPTQKNNKPAMTFYEKMGFKELEVQNIYHFIK